ncbi:hypothetical protein PoB_007426300 [Plakobranchus ocellatus]|uniref:Uncharacterized protein n=1 Tax=Plakobranchus ocellatus TaxID=259542 RepID=A0AAV4DTU5_9GAST|nr:hypothetical protein PoB_007426300 [Plakobranchus ocellatus]
MPNLEGNSNASFVHRKNKGGLVASNDFYIIIEAADRELKKCILSSTNSVTSVSKQLVHKVQTAVCEAVKPNVFSGLSTHFLENVYLPAEEDHGVQLIKSAVSIFVRMMLKHHAKLLTQRSVQDKPQVRHQLTKAIIFMHQ